MITAVLRQAGACQDNSQTDNSENKSAVATESQNEPKKRDISFTLVKNYFANTVEKLDNPKIETKEQFNAIFGMATTMGKDGKPTEIDFEKQFVIAKILPQTDLATTIEPLSLQKDESEKMTLTYKVVVGQKQSYTTKPYFAIIVDKKENGAIELKELH